MQLAKTSKTGKTKRTARGDSRRRKKNLGGKREGAGRKSLFPGKDTSWHATVYFSSEGREKLDEVKTLLAARTKRDDIIEVTNSDACEEAIHRLHHELTRRK